jgi:hypothetical protein
MPNTHTITNPGAPDGGGNLPVLNVLFNAKGVGRVEAEGKVTSGSTLVQVQGMVYNSNSTGTIPAKPPVGAAVAKLVSGNTGYQFKEANGNSVPGAIGCDSNQNFLATWAQFIDDADSTMWTQATPTYRQFVGKGTPPKSKNKS